jgi:DNA-binding response OmpR family regulator
MKNNKTILIVDDEDEIRIPIARFLRKEGFIVIEKSDGYEALDYISKNHIDLLITDIEMKKLDGLSMIEQVREFNSKLKIIIVSGHSDKNKLFRSIKLNLVDYIVKPISRKVLNNAIQMVFDRDDLVRINKDYSFCKLNRTLYKNSEIVSLSKNQSLTLEILISSENKIVTSEDIFFYINNDYTLEYSSHSVRNCIKRLRKILSEDMIKTVYGIGYTFSFKK